MIFIPNKVLQSEKWLYSSHETLRSSRGNPNKFSLFLTVLCVHSKTDSFKKENLILEFIFDEIDF